MMTGLLTSDGRVLWLSANVPSRNQLLDKYIADLARKLADWRLWQQIFAEALLVGTARLRTEVGGQRYSAALERLPNGLVVVEVKMAADVLTLREREIALFIAQGVKPAEFARRLGISVNTADSYRRNIKVKLGTNSTAGIVRWTLDTGLLD